MTYFPEFWLSSPEFVLQAKTTPSGVWLSKYGMPPRGVKYCKNVTQWDEIVADMIDEGYLLRNILGLL